MSTDNEDPTTGYYYGEDGERPRAPISYCVDVAPPKRRRRLPIWAAVAIATVVGAVIGATIFSGVAPGGSHEGAPAVCVSVAKELTGILQTENSEVVSPLIGAVQSAGEGDLASASSTLDHASSTIGSLTDRIKAVTPDYRECVK